jgi:hypothetical protein
MKYLYLIIRHCFPRKRWTVINTTSVIEGGQPENSIPVYYLLTLQDQFGNIKTKKLQ